MDLESYFESAEGFGVLATADRCGKVDAAVYSRPHFLSRSTVAFIMAGRLTHANLATNPHAVYLFHERGPGYKGVRLYIKKTKEEKDSPLIPLLRRRKIACTGAKNSQGTFLVYFRILKK